MQLVPNKRLRDVLYLFQDGPKSAGFDIPWESWVELGEDFLRRQRLRSDGKHSLAVFPRPQFDPSGHMRELRIQHEGRPYRVLYAF